MGDIDNVFDLAAAFDRLALPLYPENENGGNALTSRAVGDGMVALFFRLTRGAAPLDIAGCVSDALVGGVTPGVMEDLAVILMHTRDPRGGKGERALFGILLGMVWRLNERLAFALIPLVPEYGCWGDLVALADAMSRDAPALANHALAILAVQLSADARSDSPTLAAKWAPRENRRHSDLARRLARAMFQGRDCPRARYRRMVAGINKRLGTLETRMCAGQWRDIVPERVPARALALNRRALTNRRADGVERSEDAGRRECGARFEAAARARRLHGRALHPADIVSRYLRAGATEDPVLEAQWADLRAAYDIPETGAVVPMVDVSASMGDAAVAAAVSLGMLLSEVAHPAFRGRVLTFERIPRWVALDPGRSVFDRARSLVPSGRGASTDLEAATALVLRACVESRVPASTVAAMQLVVLSDMQFDAAAGYPAGRGLVAAFEDAGYPAAPRTVFWNLMERPCRTFPAAAHTPGVAMVSGFSPTMFAAVARGDPEAAIRAAEQAGLPPELRSDARETLDAVLRAPRYDAVRAVARRALQNP